MFCFWFTFHSGLRSVPVYVLFRFTDVVHAVSFRFTVAVRAVSFCFIVNVRIFLIYNTDTKTKRKSERSEKRMYLFHALRWLTHCSLSLDSLAYIFVQATTRSLLQCAEQQRSFLDHASISSYTVLLIEVWSHTWSVHVPVFHVLWWLTRCLPSRDSLA